MRDSRLGGPAVRRLTSHWARWAAIGMVVVFVVATLGAYLKYRAVWDSIQRIVVTDLGKRPPKYDTSVLNVLVFGSDNRSALNLRQEVRLHVGHDVENSTDSIMLVHISPGRHQVTVLSFPRDTMVPYYQCAAGPGYQGQQADPAAFERINSLLQVGGPACLWKTVEQQTGIRIDHFIELGLTGFVHVIDDVGGVRVCVPFAIDNTVSGLRLTAGVHHIMGVTALKFWRTRENIGMGSDLQRIQRDQYFMAQLVQGVLHSGLITNPLRLLRVIGDTARAMTVDSALSQGDMLRIAESFRGLSSKNVQFITAPNGQDPNDPNAVVFAEPQAAQLFSAIAHDRHLPKSLTGGKGKKHHHMTVLTISPSQVDVTVLNGSGVAGQATQVATDLTSKGFHVLGTGDAPAFSYTASVIEYHSAAQLPEARTLAAQIPGAKLKHVSSLSAGTIDLVVGSSYAGVNASPSPSSGPSVAGLSKTYGGITGDASCQSSTSAFQGPNSP